MGLCASVKVSHDKYIEWLKFSVLGAFCSSLQLEELAQCFTIERYKRGETIPTPDGEFYIVCEGCISIRKSTSPESPRQSQVLRRSGRQTGHVIHKKHAGQLLTTKSHCDLFSWENSTLMRLSTKMLNATISRDHPAYQLIRLLIESDPTEILAQVSFLKGVGYEALRSLMDLCVMETIEHHHAVYYEGDRGHKMYITLIGQVTLYYPDKAQTVLGPGSYFGEMALMVRLPRSETVRASQTCLLLTISVADFETYLHQYPIVYERIDRERRARMALRLVSLEIPFLSGLSTESLTDLSQRCVIEDKIEPDTIILRQGDIGDRFYIVIDGAVEAIVANDRDDDKISNLLEAGSYFGELALVSDHEVRSASVIALKQSVLLSISRAEFQRFFFHNPPSYASIQIRLLRHACDMQSILEHPQGAAYFQRFLAQEFSEECLLFCQDVTQYRKKSHELQPLDQQALAQELYHRYISDDSDTQVNLKSTVRDKIEKHVVVKKKKNNHEMPLADVFEDAENEILHLMEKDKFTRFKNSVYFDNLLKELDGGN